LSFFDELKRRNVFKVGIAYIVVAWLTLQVADVILNNIESPGWVFHVILLLLALGLPLSLLFAWAYELTPDGIRKESEPAGSAPSTQKPGRTFSYVIIGALVMTVAYFVMVTDRVDVKPQTSVQTLVARPSVVVLPFTNTSGDDSQDYLAFGITNELILGLQTFKDFPVISRSAAMEFLESGLSADQFAKSLGASYWLEGSISSANEGIRVLSTLSHTGGNQVWTERFQRDTGKSKLFSLADELVEKVADAVLESEIERIKRTDRSPTDAWENYIKGLEGVELFEPEKYQTSRQYLEQAVKIAPDMAEAWWALGELEVMNYMSLPLSGSVDFEDEYAIIKYFQKSHQLSPFYAAACGCLGYMLTAVGQPDEARVVFEQALEANPLSTDLRVDYAFFLLWEGRYAEAVENIDLAQKLESFSHNSKYIWSARSVARLADGDTTGALDAINRSIFVGKDVQTMPMAVAMLYILGEKESAARLYTELMQLFPGLSPKNPVLYVVLKPMDDILASRRGWGEKSDPINVEDIFHLLSKNDP